MSKYHRFVSALFVTLRPNRLLPKRLRPKRQVRNVKSETSSPKRLLSNQETSQQMHNPQNKYFLLNLRSAHEQTPFAKRESCRFERTGDPPRLGAVMSVPIQLKYGSYAT